MANNVRDFTVNSLQQFYNKLNNDILPTYASMSYVKSAYAYILNEIVDNEYVIAQTFNSHNDRLTALENADTPTGTQSDWNVTDTSSAAYIKNKPTIPSIAGLATETYVNNKVAGIVNSAPETLDTLNELAAALGNNPNFATTVSTEIGTKVSKTELAGLGYVTQTTLSAQSYITSDELETILDDSGYISSIPTNYITTSGATLLPHAEIIITDYGPDMFCTITDNIVQVNHREGGASAITSNGVFVTNAGEYDDAQNYTIYHDDSIVRTIGNSSNTINLPSASGTIALTSDIPTDNIFIIPVTKSGTSYTTTITRTEAREALYARKLLFVLYNNMVMPLRAYDSDDYGDYYFYAISNSYIYTMNLTAGAGSGPLSCYYSEIALPSAITESTVSGWGFTKNAGTLTSESDPTVPSYVKSITQANINAWNSYANVQADWDEYDSTNPAYIKNKPPTYWVKMENGGVYGTWGGPSWASGSGSFAVGSRANAQGELSLAIGNFVNAVGDNSQAFGVNTTAYAPVSHAEGNYTRTFGFESHAEGLNTTTGGEASHAEGASKYSYYLDTSSTTLDGITTYWSSFNDPDNKFSFAGGPFSHTEGINTLTSGVAAHAEGGSTYASAAYTHAEGFASIATGNNSHAEGNATIATGNNSHSEGAWTTAYGEGSHAEGGPYNYAGGTSSHSEGSVTRSLGNWSHAEGGNTMSYGVGTHAEGNYSYVIGQYSHGEGINTYTYNSAEHAEGQYNQSHKTNTTFGNGGNTIHSIGIGTASNARKNALEIMQNGNAYFINIGNYNGSTLTSAKPLHTVLNEKQDIISDLTTIRSNASAGAAKVSANNSTITIQKGGTNVDTFTTNAASNKTINIPNELPSYSSADAGKILSVNSSGQLVWITPVNIYTGTGDPSNSMGNDGDIYLQS